MGLVSDLTTLRPAGHGPDHIIAALAERQYGVVSRAQLAAAGIGDGALATRTRRHSLHRLHRGVYAVGHLSLGPLARELAAVLACGPGAVLSHRSAARLWRLLDTDAGAVDVTVRGSSRTRAGLRPHRSRIVSGDEVTACRGIPITTPARTLLDLADAEPDRDLERALDQALVNRLVGRGRLLALLDAAVGRHGRGRLRALLEREEDPAFTRSQAEESFLALVRAARLPAPELNVRLAGHLVDCAWRDSRVAVEIDGYRYHSSRRAFERDRLRDSELGAAGWRVLRVTWRQLSEQPLPLIARLSQVLGGER